MSDSLKVQILSRKLIKPTNPTPNHLKSLELSFFDQIVPPAYVEILFYYLLDEDYSEAKIEERCAGMEKSLSQVLCKYYPLAGRFVKDDLLIDCADQGVEYFEARVNQKLAEFLQGGPRIELLNKVLPWDLPPSGDLVTSPLLGVQINKFGCGGMVVGIRISHIIADACSMIKFMKDWANSCTSLTETNQVLIPSHYDHFVSLFPARTASWPEMPPTAKNPTAKIITERFLFDETLLEKIKEKAASSSSRCNFHPTRATVVSALIWKALIGVSFTKHGHLRDSIFSAAMNLRGKTALNISEFNYGNFWMPISAPSKAKKSEVELQD